MHATAAAGDLPSTLVLLQHGADPLARDSDGNTALMAAVGAGGSSRSDDARRVPLLKALLRGRADTLLEAKNKLGQGALHEAGRVGSVTLIRALLAFGCEVDRPDSLGETPLMHAVRCGSGPAVAVLLDAGANRESVSKDKMRAVDLAVLKEHTGLVGMLSNTPEAKLMHAIRTGNAGRVKSLIKAGVSCNLCLEGTTPMIEAARLNNIHLMALLLRSGADINLPDATVTLTPLLTAAERGGLLCVEYLLLQGADARWTSCTGEQFTALHLAVRSGAYKSVQQLLTHGARVAARDARGRTALHHVCSAEITVPTRVRVDIARLLIQTGCPPEVRDSKGLTAREVLDKATRFVEVPVERKGGGGRTMERRQSWIAGNAPSGGGTRRGSVVGAFGPTRSDAGPPGIELPASPSQQALPAQSQLRRGSVSSRPVSPTAAEVSLAEATEVTVGLDDPALIELLRDLVTRAPGPSLYAAVADRDRDGVISMLKKGVDPNRHIHHSTALHLAAAMGSLETMQVLVHYGADIMAPDRDGYTPLHIAAEAGQLAVVTYLLDCNASPNLAHYAGGTPLLLAAAMQRLEICQKLLMSKADGDSADELGMTALMLAAQRGRDDLVKWLLSTAVQRGPKSRSGHTAREYALIAGHQGIAGMLREDTTEEAPLVVEVRKMPLEMLKAKLKDPDYARQITAVGPTGTTALHEAARVRNKPVIDLLLDYGASTEAGDIADARPLHYAVQTNNASAASALLARGARVSAIDNRGRTALHYAAKHKALRSTTLLIHFNSDVNAKDLDGETPLMSAAASGSLSVVQVLLDSGADKTLRDNHGFDAIKYAVTNRQKEVAVTLGGQFVIDNAYHAEDNCRALMEACVGGDIAEVKRLMEARVDPNISLPGSSTTALHTAVKFSHPEVVMALLNHRARVNGRDAQGDTPLHVCAEEHGNPEVTRELMRHGADLSVRDKAGETPLHIFARRGHTTALRIALETLAREDAVLLQRQISQQLQGSPSQASMSDAGSGVANPGPDDLAVNIPSHDGSTALMVAVQSGREAAIEILLSHGARPDIRNLAGKSMFDTAREAGFKRCMALVAPETALADAVRAHDHRLIRDLLSNGVHPDRCGADGLTALHEAARLGDLQAATLLLKHHRSERRVDPLLVANLNSREAEALRTPLHTAAREGHLALVGVLIQFGADVSAKDRDVREPLHLVAGCGANADKIIAALLKAGAHINARDLRGTTPLMCAGCAGDVLALNTLLAAGGDPSLWDLYGDTAFDMTTREPKAKACARILSGPGQPAVLTRVVEQRDMVEFTRLLAGGADPDVRDATSGLPCIVLCASLGLEPFVAQLVAHGANPNALAENGDSALHAAVSPASAEDHAAGRVRGSVPVLRTLIEAGANPNARAGPSRRTPLTAAVVAGHHSAVAVLARSPGVDLDAKDAEGYTALMHAAKLASAELVRLLVEAGADPKAHGKNAPGALWLARQSGNLECIGALAAESEVARAIQAGSVERLRELRVAHADFNEREKSGSTPLHEAVRFNQAACVAYLLKHHADPLAVDEEGTTPLQLAAEILHVGCLPPLLASAAGAASLSAKDSAGRTALHRCAGSVGKGSRLGAPALTEAALTCMHWLLLAGIDVNARDRSGSIALHAAVTIGAAERVAALLFHGSVTHIRRDDGRTPTLLAKALKNTPERQHILALLEDPTAATLPEGCRPFPSGEYTLAQPPGAAASRAVVAAARARPVLPAIKTDSPAVTRIYGSPRVPASARSPHTPSTAGAQPAGTPKHGRAARLAALHDPGKTEAGGEGLGEGPGEGPREAAGEDRGEAGAREPKPPPVHLFDSTPRWRVARHTGVSADDPTKQDAFELLRQQRERYDRRKHAQASSSDMDLAPPLDEFADPLRHNYYASRPKYD